jgi:hypothetical protein
MTRCRGPVTDLIMVTKKGEIATYLAMTKRRAQRGNLSFICLLAVERRDRHVPRDDIFHLSLRAQRGNLSFVRLPAPHNRDCFVPRDDKNDRGL